ncbi:acetylglutamate kinase [Puniceicoccus vermicola]|uniref:acetylglutamate kinase n=1 Tax=Puniceicoccus vermicola TaxID=388746 RepID=UPI001C8CEAAB|nr:acetylglutamate kinase [Puniceicoccus vermicola]
MDISQLDVTSKAKVLIEALPYIQRFKGSVFVVKYGGSFMDDPDPEVRAKVATDLAFLSAVGIHVVVVHGGGKAITRAMDASGLEARFEKGLRVTDAATVEIVRKTLDEEVNLEICEIVQRKLGRPISIPGFKVLRTRRLATDPSGDPIDIGFVGEVERVDPAPIRKAISDGYMPIVSPVGADTEGQAYNTNADVAASRVASALRARRLVYLCDVPGLMKDPSDPSTLISSLPDSQVAGLKSDGIIAKGMIPKVDSAVHALQNGVNRVHFIDGRMPHSLLLEIFTDKGIGTEIVRS